MEDRELRQDAAYVVRDARQLGSVPADNVSAQRKSTCDKFDAILAQTSDAAIAAMGGNAGTGGTADDGNNGHGNDPGGVDPGNPGRRDRDEDDDD